MKEKSKSIIESEYIVENIFFLQNSLFEIFKVSTWKKPAENKDTVSWVGSDSETQVFSVNKVWDKYIWAFESDETILN